MSSSLTDLLSAALSARAGLITALHAEQTDAYRVFHGTAEGAPFQPEELNAMLALAQQGMRELFELQRAALAD